MVFFRRGVEEWIRRYHYSATVAEAWSGVVPSLHAAEEIERSSFVWHTSHYERSSSHARLNASSEYAEIWRSFMRSTPPAGWRSSPLVVTGHEGTWYPFSLMRQFVRAYTGSVFERVANAQQAGAACPCFCTLYNNTPCALRGGGWSKAPSKVNCVGGCTFEELLLPTYASQASPTSSEPSTRRASRAYNSPPVVLSIAAVLRSTATGASTDKEGRIIPRLMALAQRIAARADADASAGAAAGVAGLSTGPFRHVFAFKVLHHSFLHTHQALCPNESRAFLGNSFAMYNQVPLSEKRSLFA